MSRLAAPIYLGAVALMVLLLLIAWVAPGPLADWRHWHAPPPQTPKLDDVQASMLHANPLAVGAYPVILERSSEGLYLLQRVRDEAHRFALAHHRKRRGAAMTASELDGVPGLGPARKAKLLKHFGSLKRLRAASVEEIASVPGMGEKLARGVLEALSPPSAPAPAPVDGA